MEKNNISRYFHDIAKLSPLTSQEESRLALLIQEGDETALSTLVSANLKFVVTVARQYQGRGVSLEDLICEGNIGLVEAAKRFNPSAGFRFISYAVYWIKQAICFAITNNRSIRLPMNRVGNINTIRKLREKGIAEGTKVSDKELCSTLGISLSDLRTLDRALSPVLSLDSSIGDDEDSCLEDIVRDKSADQDTELRSESLLTSLKDVLDTVLSERESRIIRLSYGISCTEQDDEHIGQMLNISSERVRQVRTYALSKLRKSPKTVNSLREYLG